MHKRIWLGALMALILPAQAAAFGLADTWTFGGHKAEVSWGTLTPDGARVYTQSGPQLLSWDARSGQLLSSREPAQGQPLRILDADLNTPNSPDGQRVLVSVGQENPHAELLELSSGVLSADFGPLRGGASVQWTPGQTAVVLTSYEAPQIRYWRQQDGQVRTITLAGGLEDAGEQRSALSPDAQTLYVLTPSQGLRAYDPATGQLLWQRRSSEVTGRNGQPLKSWQTLNHTSLLSHNPAKPQLLLSAQGGLLLLNTQGAPQPLWLDKGFDTVTGSMQVSWSKDGSRAFVTTNDFIHEIDTATGKTVGVVDGVGLVAQTPQRLWTRSWDRVLAFDRASGLDAGSLPGAPAWNSPLALNAAGEPQAALLKTKEGLRVQSYTSDSTSGESTPLNDHFTLSAHLSPSGARVASVGPAGLQMMDTRSHKVLWRSKAQGSYELAFSPDGKLLALGEQWQTRLLDAATGKELAALQAPEAALNAGARGLNRTLTFSPNGQQLLIGYEAGAAALWQVATRQVAQTFSKARGWILSAAFSPDGQRVALGSGGGEVRIFRVADGQLLASAKLSGAVRALAFGADGSLAAASLGGDLQRWNASGQQTLSEYLPVAVTALAWAGPDLLAGNAKGQLARYNAAGKLLDSINTGSLAQSLDWNASLARAMVSNRDNTLHLYTLSDDTSSPSNNKDKQ